MAAVLLLLPAAAKAQPVTTLEGDFVAALPAALSTGLATGVGLGITHGCALAWGARASWSTASEYTLAWEVDNDDLRLRVFGALQQVAGRATLALRLGLGGTLVHEVRTRAQGSRAGLSGAELETVAWDLLPAADLEAVVLLHVVRRWSVTVSGGPSLHLLASDVRAGWTSSVGVGWEP